MDRVVNDCLEDVFCLTAAACGAVSCCLCLLCIVVVITRVSKQRKMRKTAQSTEITIAQPVAEAGHAMTEIEKEKQRNDQVHNEILKLQKRESMEKINTDHGSGGREMQIMACMSEGDLDPDSERRLEHLHSLGSLVVGIDNLKGAELEFSVGSV